MLKTVRNIFGEFCLWLCNFVIAYIPSHTIRLFYYRRIMGFQIGKGSSIHLGCHFNSTGKFEMGQNSVINQYCHIDNRGGIKIGNNVSVSPHAGIITADHDINDPLFTGRTGAVIMEDYVFVGYGAKIFKECTLARGSVVGAMSLLTKSTESFGIYMGTPAKLVKYRNKEVNYSTSYRRLFH